MESNRSGFRMDAAAGWGDILVRMVKVALIAFVVLQLKEWLDAGAFDTPGTAADAGLIAGGILVVEAILMWTRPKATT